MSAAMCFLRNVIVLIWTVCESLLDYRRRRPAAEFGIAERALWMHRWCASALRRLRVTVQREGPIPEGGLIVSNHLSYLDIFAFGTVMPCVFVSKAEVRNWPVFGTLTTIAGTVYIDRARRSDTRNANDGIRHALQQGIRVVIFPEGTSTDGSNVLPFYPSLFEPAVQEQIPITAAHISYEMPDGDVSQEVAWGGNANFLPHLVNLLSKRGVSATIGFGAQPRIYSSRKIAAAETREGVLKIRKEKLVATPDRVD
jgi:1-acyl-sn-glycerol-3-phosphate acyltransferase